MLTIIPNWQPVVVHFTIALLLTACGQGGGENGKRGLPLPEAGLVADEKQGETLFQRNCAVCHGDNALGSRQGPPLIHKVYRPGHHADLAFYMAVARGTPQHHWQFGDMPPQAGVTPEEVAHIITYVRAAQRRAGIY
jgi:mono/diheme cytochrome c family protein